MVLNLDGKIELVSESVSNHLHYSKEDLQDKSIYDIIHAGDQQRMFLALDPTSKGNAKCNGIVLFRHMKNLS